MALKTYNPTTPSLRQLVIVDRSELHKGKPVKALTVGKSEKGGRNNAGRAVYSAAAFSVGVDAVERASARRPPSRRHGSAS